MDEALRSIYCIAPAWVAPALRSSNTLLINSVGKCMGLGAPRRDTQPVSSPCMTGLPASVTVKAAARPGKGSINGLQFNFYFDLLSFTPVPLGAGWPGRKEGWEGMLW